MKKKWSPRTAAGQIAVQLVRRYYLHDVGRDSAALTYYLLFALFPLLVFISTLLGILKLDVDSVTQVLSQIVPADVMSVLESYLEYVSANASRQLLWFSLIFSVCAEMDAAFKKEYRVNDPAITVSVRPAETALLPLDENSSRSVVCMLTCLPNGIQAMSADMPGLVQTSLNLGILTTGDDAVHASFSVRSSVATQKQMLIQRLRCLMERLGGSVSTHGEYPGWEYMPQSPLRDLMVQVFTDQYGYAPKVEAIHAGLECGLFSAKLPGLDCVSFGPDLKEIHTFRESMSVASVQRVYAMVVETLKRMH